MSKGPLKFEARANLNGRWMSVREMEKALADRREELANMSTLTAQLAVFLDRWVQLNFRGQGARVGGWEPFSPDNSRLREDPAAKLLQDTGRLRASMMPFSTSTEAGIGSALPYARPHHEGTRRLPERRLLPLVHEVEGDVMEIVRDHVQGVLK